MSRPKGFTTVSFTAREATVAKLKALKPRYGDTSRVLRELLEAYVDGRVSILSRKGLKSFPATA